MDTTSARLIAEVAFPGAAIGLGAGMVAGGVAAVAGLPPGYVVLTTLGLGLPLALFGAGYDLLLASGRIRLGGVTPAVFYWLPAFPLARLFHEAFLDLGLGRGVALPEALPQFVAYQAILSTGFAIGFLWLHEHLGPLWWPRIRDHNPVAARYVHLYTRHAAAMEHRRRAKKRR
ncbi:hypothetical protein Rxycam_02980 [Rubrobacter xylanophilus DSM 9941]|uniref:Uncharacterized protein n=1 Tax=Rubrobacter xylanophilus TaxID=49319 RepID=A0A510HEJ7_9ACTN|nr:hypothetical protein [Rubrobacter xylanophilus]QYJ17141.1 hypothetical protein Rxycam_02980 [Rubrobacter xylanophilus DSM 9941]BBL78348.1 hypothetical protein RxyAA322_02020 [Rubrobacter xylanophilus]